MKKSLYASLACAALAGLVGCVSVDEDVLAARQAILEGRPADAAEWSGELATNSHYSTRLGAVEAGRIAMLAGDSSAAERWFRAAIDAAIDRKEAKPVVKLGDVGNTALSATVTDDRTREYYLAPYEINQALLYGILAQLRNGRRDDALADARLAVYVQDSLAETYGADLKKGMDNADAQASAASDRVCDQQNAALQEMMASTRNSWENPVLWWLTGELFEADGETEMAAQSYRKAAACRPDNPVFARAVARANASAKAPVPGKAKVIVVYEEGLVPMRESLKIPVPVYTAMSIDIPQYAETRPYRPGAVAVSGAANLVAASPALDVRALAARDLSEQMPGVVTRNITRAAVAAGAQAAVNAAGNEYAQLAVLLANAAASALRRADTRSWATLPDGVQVWEEDAMAPGNYNLGFELGGGRAFAVPLTLAAGDVKLVWVANVGATLATAVMCP